MNKIFTLFIIALLITSIPVSGKETNQITSKNWLNHPAVKEIRDIYREVRTGIEKIVARVTGSCYFE